LLTLVNSLINQLRISNTFVTVFINLCWHN